MLHTNATGAGMDYLDSPAVLTPDFPLLVSRDMAVLTFLKGFGPGGVERIALRLVRAWRASGMDVDLLMASETGPMRAAGDADGYSLAKDWPLVGAGWPLLRLVVAAARSIRRRRPTVLFCPGNAYMIVAALLKIMLGRRCPTIVAKVSNDLERRDLHWSLRPFYHLWLRVLGRAIDQFAVLSDPMAQEVVRMLAVPRQRVHVVPNPVLSIADIDDPRPRPCRPGERRFIAVGRLERQKDYPLMLRAFAAARRPGDTLTICGEGGDAAPLKRLASGLGLAGHAHFVGHCSDVRARMAEHDVLLLTSIFEGQPGAVVEALSAGLGVLATRCCAGMAELLDDGALGTLVEQGDEAALVRAISAVRPGTQDHTRALRKARNFTIEAAVPAYARLFAMIRTDVQQGAWPARVDDRISAMQRTGHA